MLIVIKEINICRGTARERGTMTRVGGGLREGKDNDSCRGGERGRGITCKRELIEG